jgi:hypothetical protein
MNAALTVAIWVSVVVCVVGIVLVSCWLLLDWQRDAGQARAAARMAREYAGDDTTDSRPQDAAEYTWPILAQQPPVFYEKAITIPIPRCALVESGSSELKARDTCEDATDRWPVVDSDAAGDLAEWYAAGDLPTEALQTSQIMRKSRQIAR